MDLIEHVEYTRFQTKAKFILKHVQRQGSECPEKVQVSILSKSESTNMSYFMRRLQVSVAPCPKRQQPVQKTFKASLKIDGTTKTNGRTRQSKAYPLRSKFSWDPDLFCSDSESSGASDGVDRTSTLPVSVVVDLTGKSEHLVKVSPCHSHRDVVLLSSGEEEMIRPPRASVSVGKVSLPVQSPAEDTLETLRLKNDTLGQKLISDGTCTSLIESQECLDSQLDETNTEGSVVSGPSSPHSAQVLLKCRDCRRLFTKMRRQGPPKNKKRDHNPASLSCDEWLLVKAWRPQRRRQERGRLWVHLKRIRKLAMERSVPGVTKTVPCSRPHIFLRRNLRHCRRVTSDSNTKPHQRRRHRAKILWPPLGSKRRIKRKSLERDDTLKQFYPLDLTVSNNATKDQSVNGDAHHTDSQKQGTVLKHIISGINGVLERPAGYDTLEGTRRVLKFDDPLSALSMETQKPQQGIMRKTAGRRPPHVGQADCSVNDWNCSMAKTVLCEEVDEFRTPPDLSAVESKIVRKSHSSFFSSDHSSQGVQRGSFRSMLAVFEKSHNQIIKESHN